MMIKAKNTLMKERTWIIRVASELGVSAVHPDTDSPLHDECVIAVREELNLHLSLQPDVTDGMRPPLNLLLTSPDADCLVAVFFFS